MSSSPSEIFTSSHPTSVIVPSLTTSPVSSIYQVHFFRTLMSFSSVNLGSDNIWNVTESWLKSTFNTEDLQLLDVITLETEHRYECVFRLQAISTITAKQITQEIKERLTNTNYTKSTLVLAVDPSSIFVYSFEPGFCQRESVQTEVGEYTWPLTRPVKTVQLNCVGKAQRYAVRDCKLTDDTDQAAWSEADLEQCSIWPTFPDSILGMENVPVTTENAEEIARHMLILTSQTLSLSPRDLEIVVAKMSAIVEMATIYQPLAKDVVGIINNILNQTDDLTGFSVRILQIMETVGNNLEFMGTEVNITTDNVSMAVVNIDFIHFWGIAFGVLSYIDGFIQQIYRNNTSLENPVAFIELPPVLSKWSAGKQALKSRILFQFYGETSLFEDRALTQQKLNSYVVSSSIEGKNVKNLSEPVKVTLKHLTPKQDGDQVSCVFWDFKQNHGAGGWSSSGCEVVISNSEYTTCYCNHLTHFGVLLVRIGQVPALFRIKTSLWERSVRVWSSPVHWNVRRDYPSKILMNLCMSLFMLNIIFLTNSWVASFGISGLCITVAALLHYFLLSSFTWMGIEAVHMYFALVKVFNIYIRHYMLKFCVIGWGVPAAVVGILLSININLYGYETKLKAANPAELFCWFRNDIAFYLSVVAYFGLVFLINLAMFIVVLHQIQVMKVQRPGNSTSHRSLQRLKGSVSLTVLLGLTWGFAFFAWGPTQETFMYFFTIFNTLQGFFIFVFHCLLKDNVCSQWRVHLCCGRFQLSEYSEWSRTATSGNLRGVMKSFNTHSKTSFNSNSTTASSNGSRKNLILSPNFGNGNSSF
ncbi:adhesion G-protein coupled receptor G4-like [Chiloscyllium plagiosum]|uniref:adhesion G-protein coupled receptor G4-like n=1 Tax=Chiloscyllium plagiosum TaxID=36176 RepID=UPI001CB810FD|nr:adhesion G-protein coupled receptor G4-like [Chiloscyllium plagiosum]